MLFIPISSPNTQTSTAMKRDHQDSSGGPPPKGKGMSAEEDAGVDELLAALGYKVRSSDMADVAQKLEQLEMAIGTTSAHDDSIVSQLTTDTIHYNPSDLSTWLESMLSELNTPPPPLPPPTQISFSNPSKRMRTSSPSSSSEVQSSSLAPLPLVVDPQEAGIRLIHALMGCAEAIQQENLKTADGLLKQISFLAASQSGAMRKVAGYFAEALARRIYHPNPQIDCAALDSTFSDILQMHFYESCPYLKFAHFTANQAILEAFSGCRSVHVIDFGIKQGMQWPALMQALSLRPGGPPTFRLTGIGPPQLDNPDALQQVGWKLAQLAETINVKFEFRSIIVNSLVDLELDLLQLAEEEAVAVNSVFELHRLLAQPGAIEKVLGLVGSIRPKTLTMVEQEANHNSGTFAERFTEALHYYSTMFDSLEGGDAAEQQQDQMMTEIYLGREICNVVASEGTERTDRHETMVQWKGRMARAGFEPVHIGSNAYKQASMLLALFSGGDGYRVEERDGCLTLGWHTRPLIATSAWRFADA